MYSEGFASKLKKARENTGFTQREISAETKIKQSTLASYETGRTQPDIETLGILADFYGVSIDWLVGTAGGKKEILDRHHVHYEKNQPDSKQTEVSS